MPATVPSSVAEHGRFFGDLPQSGFDPSGLCNDPGTIQHQLYAFPFALHRRIRSRSQQQAQRPFDPIALKILNFYPKPNRRDESFVTTETLSVNNDQFGLKLRPVPLASGQPEPALHVQRWAHHRPALDFRRQCSWLSRGRRRSRAELRRPGNSRVLARGGGRGCAFLICETSSCLTSISTTNRPPASAFNTNPRLPAAAGPPFIQVGGYASVGDPITGRATHSRTPSTFPAL